MNLKVYLQLITQPFLHSENDEYKGFSPSGFYDRNSPAQPQGRSHKTVVSFLCGPEQCHQRLREGGVQGQGIQLGMIRQHGDG